MCVDAVPALGARPNVRTRVSPSRRPANPCPTTLDRFLLSGRLGHMFMPPPTAVTPTHTKKTTKPARRATPNQKRIIRYFRNRGERAGSGWAPVSHHGRSPSSVATGHPRPEVARAVTARPLRSAQLPHASSPTHGRPDHRTCPGRRPWPRRDTRRRGPHLHTRRKRPTGSKHAGGFARLGLRTFRVADRPPPSCDRGHVTTVRRAAAYPNRVFPRRCSFGGASDGCVP